VSRGGGEWRPQWNSVTCICCPALRHWWDLVTRRAAQHR